MDSASPCKGILPRKRSRMDCIIHCSDEDSNSHLVSPKNLDSWKTLLRAAEIRGHIQILDIAKELSEREIPPVLYHRKCRSIFTMKKLLDAITRKPSSSAFENAEEGGHLGVFQARQGFMMNCVSSV